MQNEHKSLQHKKQRAIETVDSFRMMRQSTSDSSGVDIDRVRTYEPQEPDFQKRAHQFLQVLVEIGRKGNVHTQSIDFQDRCLRDLLSWSSSSSDYFSKLRLSISELLPKDRELGKYFSFPRDNAVIFCEFRITEAGILGVASYVKARRLRADREFKKDGIVCTLGFNHRLDAEDATDIVEVMYRGQTSLDDIDVSQVNLVQIKSKVADASFEKIEQAHRNLYSKLLTRADILPSMFIPQDTRIYSERELSRQLGNVYDMTMALATDTEQALETLVKVLPSSGIKGISSDIDTTFRQYMVARTLRTLGSGVLSEVADLEPQSVRLIDAWCQQAMTNPLLEYFLNVEHQKSPFLTRDIPFYSVVADGSGTIANQVLL